MESEAPIHVLLVPFPSQGHVNPFLRLGKHLAAKGCFVTFTTAKNKLYTLKETSSTPINDGFLTFDIFDEGLGDEHSMRYNFLNYSAHLEKVGKQVISQMLKKHAATKRSVSCIINDPFFSWVTDVASEFNIPCAPLWNLSAATFTACHHYFKKLSPFPTVSEPYIDVQLPDIVLKHNEIPEFLHPFSHISFVKTLLMKQFDNLSKTFCVLMDTFEELEHGHINYLSQFHLVRSVGPLFKNLPALKTGDDFSKTDECIEWLNSKPHASVVYISLGTIVTLSAEQIGEFAHGLLNSLVLFLWVMRSSEREEAVKANVMPEGFFESERGKVVQWSPQEEVLAHPSVACFLSHCGWNSTVEALALGMPMLTFAQWGDLITNEKFLVEVYGVGIRVRNKECEKTGVVNRDEMKRLFLEATVGEKAEELRKNAMKWKSAAEAAKANGGTSDRNLDAFVEDVKKLINIKRVPQYQ